MPGFLLSVFFLFLTVVYGYQRFSMWYYRLDPTITVTNTQNFFTHLEPVDLADQGFKIAFGVMNLITKEPLENPDFVQFEVSLDLMKNLDFVDRVPLAYHRCTKADFDLFYPISVNNKEYARQLLENQILNCMDPD